jgi:hypothetical protein
MIRLGYQFVPEPRPDAGSVDIAATADTLPAALDVQ